ncbi:MAG: HNH endonuclease [Bacteroidaceae bacterium]|nr:HNH endonuclease [Bacteroidaceae bacterium]
MVYKLREKTPQRRTDIDKRNDYKKYRNELIADFNGHCGYCGDRDWPRKEHFEIDHFVPKDKMVNLKENDYSNLVYACRSCNNSKRAKWPTGDESKPNNGKIGWIDPCNKEYDEQFERSEFGSIVAKTELGEWMFDNLKLWKRQHEMLWNYEQLEIVTNEIEKVYQNCEDKDVLKDFINVMLKQKNFLEQLYRG